MNELKEVVNLARNSANKKVRDAVAGGMLTREAYVRFLSNQYHLTNGVQKPLMRVASSERLARKRKLREFLFRFALEEEPHYLLALHDLKALNAHQGPRPLEASLWWAYFESIIDTKPFERLGATCILENIGVGLGAIIKPLFGQLEFIRPETTRFLMVHLHEDIPHGDQVLSILDASKLEYADVAELVAGARIAATLYLRMLDWYFEAEPAVPCTRFENSGDRRADSRTEASVI